MPMIRSLYRFPSFPSVLHHRNWASWKIYAPSSSISPFSSSSSSPLPSYDPDFSSFDWIPHGNGHRVAVALSGGVDSAVAALVMHRKGYDVTTVFMKNWDAMDEEDSTADEICMTSPPSLALSRHGKCSYSIDLHDARAVAKRINVPLVEVDFVKDYWNYVFTPFINDYQSGKRTPNPDVFCNKFIKFAKFIEYVREKLGVETVAFGHYAKLLCPWDGKDEQNGSDNERSISTIFSTTAANTDNCYHTKNPHLQCAADPDKDQTYFLCMTSGESFRDVIFPLGGTLKSQVKQIAAKYFKGLNVLSKKESMGICFIGPRSFPEFLGSYISLTAGDFIDWDTGRVVGKHSGKEVYTIGQGAKIGGSPRRYYIVEKSTIDGSVYVVANRYHHKLNSSEVLLKAGEFSWVSGDAPPEIFLPSGKQFKCRLRHGQLLRDCSVTISKDKDDSELMRVKFTGQ